MPRSRQHRDPVPDEDEDPGEMPEVDEMTPEGATRLRQWAIRTDRRSRRLHAELRELETLRLENAAMRAGLDVEEPSVKLLLQTYTGPPEVEPVREAFIELSASVIAHQRAGGRSFTDLAAELDDEPTAAELEAQRASRALSGSGQ